MDLDYNTVKYLVLVLSVIVLAYVIYFLYTELWNVRTDFSKMKTKITTVEDDIDYVKGLITVEEDAQSEEDQQDNTENFSELLNNNGFLNSLNLNYSKLTEYPTELEEIEETDEVEEIDTEEHEETPIEFLQAKTCDTILTTGKNKGKQCTKNALDNSDKCLKHTDKSIRKDQPNTEELEV